MRRNFDTIRIDRAEIAGKALTVLVTPALLRRLPAPGAIADKELSVLLARDQLVPVMHGTTYDALRDVSPMLDGMNTAEAPMAVVAAKLAELIAL
jgi:hypothetical protein